MGADLFPARAWEVLLLGGASGVGKTAVSYRLARHFGIGITEVDDFQVLLETMTTPEQQPALHFWKTHPNPYALSAAEIFAQGLRVGEAMAPGLEAVIANHLETDCPVLLEGDFLLPALAARAAYGEQENNGRVLGLFLIEEDEEQLVANFLAREPARGPQRARAQVSRLYSQWLRQESERLGVLALPARPWETLFSRILTALTQGKAR